MGSSRKVPVGSRGHNRFRLNDQWNNHRRRQRLGGIMILDHGDNGHKMNYNYNNKVKPCIGICQYMKKIKSDDRRQKVPKTSTHYKTTRTISEKNFSTEDTIPKLDRT